MPAITALTINDGATTPVAHTFSPVSTNGSKAEFADRSSATMAGFRVISDELRKPASPTGAWRRIIGYMFPVEAVVDGKTVVVDYDSAQVIFNFSQTSTDQRRKDAHAYVNNHIGLTSVKSAITGNEPWY